MVCDFVQLNININFRLNCIIMKTLKQLRNLTPRQFEESIATLLPKLGYKNIKLTSQTADSGYDISAYKDTKKVFLNVRNIQQITR